MKRTNGEKIFSIFNYIILTCFAMTTLYPFLYTLSLSLSTTSEAMRAGFHLYPKEISFTAYQMVLSNKELFVTYSNTLYRTLFGTTLSVLVTCMYAYAMSRPEMPHRKFLTSLVVFTMIFNGGTIPTYLVYKSYNLLDTRWVYILPYLITAYNMIIAKSYFQSLPNEIYEAAIVDGANDFKIFFKIIMPLSKPIVMTLALWIAVFHWNQWYDCLIYITDPSKKVVQSLLQSIVQENSTAQISQGVVNPDVTSFTPQTVKSATIMITMLPILFAYPFVQKYFVKGVTVGAVKG